MVIYLDGRTSLNNNYVVRDVQRSKIKRSDEVMKSAKKCAKKLIAIAKIHGIISRGMYAYMITSTYGDGIDIYKRRDMHNRLIDRLRKEIELEGYFWVTEAHKSGKIHHHMYIYTKKYWDYKGNIKKLSELYTGSVNGLDVIRLEKSNTGYLIKTIAYMTKSVNDGIKLPYRHWGTSKIQRGVVVSQDEYPVVTQKYYNPIGKVGYNTCARVDKDLAVVLCAEATLARDL